MGNSNNVDPNNQFFLYGGDVANSSYDITGSNSSATTGFRLLPPEEVALPLSFRDVSGKTLAPLARVGNWQKAQVITGLRSDNRSGK